MKAIVTGARGFVGSHLVEHLLRNTDWEIVVFDKMSDVSFTKDRLTDIETWNDNKERVEFYSVDLTLPVPQAIDREIGEVGYIFHLAAESHVDRSIEEPRPFILNNVAATISMLDYARNHPELRMFINFSTDEVYGPAPDGVDYKEYDRHHPTNPYSASKSAQEQIGKAYANCYGVPVVTTHTMNLYGERQHPEKFIPMVIKKVLNNEEVTIHANKDRTRAGSRFYLHARNLSDALLHILDMGYHGYDEWNIAGLEEIDNLTLAQRIADHLGKPLRFKMVDFHSSRPGHDLRYALDSHKLLRSGYAYPKNFKESLNKTIDWYLENRSWL